MDAGVASTLLFCYPIITAVLMTVLFHEHVTWGTAISILLAITGIALLYHGGDGVKISTFGFVLVMLSSLLYAMYIVAVNQWHTTLSSLQFTFWIVLFGWLTILAFAFVAEQPIQMLSGIKQWTCAIQLALLPTVLSLFLMTVAIKSIGSTPSAIMGALEPVTAVAIGVGLFGEAFTARFALGILLILIAVVIIILKKDKTAQQK